MRECRVRVQAAIGRAALANPDFVNKVRAARHDN
jgi:2,4-dienoyl-CoA reductase-like NADH-dependent reductase (Old Yellow Enzyme family)